MAYQTLTAVPAYVLPIWQDGKLMNADAPMRWSNVTPPPAIGDTVHINFNRLGSGTVTGYFSEDGWFGLLVRLHDAPEWHRKQRNNDPIAHIFGNDLRAAPPVVAMQCGEGARYGKRSDKAEPYND